MELPTCRRRLHAMLALFAAAVPPLAECGTGRTPGFASVSPEGEAEYAIPLPLPSGTNGLTPQLSLEYRQRTRNGLLGVGWSVGGSSRITRCRRTAAQDGLAGGPGQGSFDRFCLDGQRLVSLDALSYGAPSGEYRTEIESFARIRAHAGIGGHGPGHFTVEASDGRTFEYGATADSRIDRSAGATTNGATAWALNRIRDRAGNVIDYAYTEDVAGGSFRLARIRYNSNPGAGVPASHEITFSYENRSPEEVDTGFVGTEPVREVARLSRIAVRHEGTLRREFRLSYEPHLSSSGRSRLASIQECGAGASSCRTETTLRWQDGSPGLVPGPAIAAPSLSSSFDTQWRLADFSGDGLLDYAWAEGGTLGTATIRYRLGQPGGAFSAPVNSGVACPNGIGRVFDTNGDGRADLLLVSAARQFEVMEGTAAGLSAAREIGVAAPAGLVDYRGLDFNGDGLGDVAWSERIGTAPFDVLQVRARMRRSAGGYAQAETLYEQPDRNGTGATGGRFIDPGDALDVNGDGRQDLLLDEELSVARISVTGNRVEQYQAGSHERGVALQFNDDDCADFAYKHPAGTIRVRISPCAASIGSIELLGPAWSGPARLHAQDWNGDGRDDLLLQGTSTWQLVLSRGESLSAISDTGVPHLGAAAHSGFDLDADGLDDLVTRVGGELRFRLGAGVLPDLLLSARDGLGVTAEFDYGLLTDATVHLRSAGAAYPEQDVQPPIAVVTKLTLTDGSGRGSRKFIGFRYEGLRRHLQGRGSLGFRKQLITDLTPERLLATEITRRQDFPFTGLPESVVTRQASGKPVVRTTIAWATIPLQRRWFPYPASATTRRHEIGGSLDGLELSTAVRTIAGIDAASGLVTEESLKITESGGGEHAGASATWSRRHLAHVNDTANWCMGRPELTERTASHTLPGGNAVTRTTRTEWDAAGCRPTGARHEPGDPALEVAREIGYDAFGNPARESVVGAGMAARTVTIDWGERGQLPHRMVDPLSQSTRFTWDPGSGLPLSMTDPNGLAVTWAYDGLDFLTRQVLPDGSSTSWRIDACKADCDARTRYVLVEQERDRSGTARLTTSAEMDQHERIFRLRTQMPGGGQAVVSVDRDDLGRIRRSYLPAWSGQPHSAYWEFAYDLAGRRTAARLVDGGLTRRALETRYDGFTIARQDARGGVSERTSTAWGTIARSIDALRGVTSYDHDAWGNLSGVRDAQGNAVSSVAYDRRGLKTSQVDADLGKWTWTRNALGETTALRNAKGQVSRYAYDALGRVTRRTDAQGTFRWIWGNSAGSRNVGRLAARSGPGYTEALTYDSVGRPASQTITSDSSYRFSFTYDDLGLLDMLTYPAPAAASPIRIRHSYDAGRLAAIRDAGAGAQLFWSLNAVDAAGNALDESLGAGLRTISGFDPATGLLEYRQTGPGGGSAIQNLAFEWDASGNLVGRSDVNEGLAERFAYDALHRLVETRRNGEVTLELDYDLLGNIRRKSDVCTGAGNCYTYHSQRKHAVTKAGGVSYSYDANGNMVRRAGASLAWTAQNQPSSIAHANGNRSQFSYGPDGNRWRQVATYGGTTETTLYAAGLHEKVTRAGDTTWRSTILSPAGPVALMLQPADGSTPVVRFLTRDHLGSVDRIVGAGGVEVAQTFAPFGNRLAVDGASPPGPAAMGRIAGLTRDGFTGHEHLDNVDLIHMNGRVYDPQLGRFTSADPWVTRPYDGQGLNRYSYVLNNPLTNADPSGFDTPCVESAPGTCAQVTIVGVTWADYMRYLSGGVAQAESARERDPCGQESDAFTCAMQGRQFVSPASVVLTVGSRPDPSLSRGRFDFLEGAAARIANLAISSSPVALLFGADPEFEWFDVPDSDQGSAGAVLGEIGSLAGGFAGIARKGVAEIAQSPREFAQSLQGSGKYPGVDRFKDITLKKGSVIYAGFPGQGYFYTTRSALRRAGGSARALFGGLQVAPHEVKPLRSKIAAFEVIEDTKAAFGLAIANTAHGDGWLPQIVVPSYRSSLRYLDQHDLPAP